jgi:hypothetical protein
MRSAELATTDLDEALAAEHIQTFETIEITNTREVPTGAGVTRSTDLGEPALELTVPDPGPDWGQVVLAVDESGVVTWNVARTTDGGVDVTRGGASRTYVIRRRVPPPSAPAETRGLLGVAGRKLLKVLVFPLIDPVVGDVGERLAARWEAVKRPYRLRTFTPEDYQSSDATQLTEDAWQRLQAGPALMLVHGTFSRAHSGFGAFPPDLVEWLHERYEGRVFAFDHYTLSEDPRQNVEWLLGQVPDDARLNLDIICHSRGGLVSRLLAEQQADLPLGTRQVDVGRVVFLAAPHAGTILADPEHLGDLVDAATNLLNLVPDIGISDVLGAVITVVKQLAVGALGGLDGLTSMAPGGEVLATLNGAPKAPARYYALAADFEPASGSGLAAYARDTLHDLLFRAPNDLIVPTSGAWDTNGSANFPIEDRYIFPASDGVAHNDYARHPVTAERVREWLG